MANKQKNCFIGIDLGWRQKKTTGLCVLEDGNLVLLMDIFGKELLKAISPYLEETQVIAIDAPLTLGRGKGKMRLYEKFLSTKIFRQEKINPLPPALLSELSDFAREIVGKLGDRGFVLDINLIEVFPTFIKTVGKEELFLDDSSCQTENQKSALIGAELAFLHSQFKTRWLGYKDGFLFLPEFSFWKEEWRQKFEQAWQGRDRLRYRRLKTNIFNN